MSWSIAFIESAQKSFLKLDQTIQKRIIHFLEGQILSTQDPYRQGKALKGKMKNLWRYRISDYRVICKIDNQKLVILVVDVGHRREIYL